jgi:DNA-binding XRE family transcriptional regulator
MLSSAGFLLSPVSFVTHLPSPFARLQGISSSFQHTNIIEEGKTLPNILLANDIVQVLVTKHRTVTKWVRTPCESTEVYPSPVKG